MAARVSGEGIDRLQHGHDSNNDDWIKVSRNKNKNSNIQQGRFKATSGNTHSSWVSGNSIRESSDRISTSVYVTNLPWKATTKEIWDVCAQWGTVVDVYVSGKLSSVGARFGFVRFIRVRDVVNLITNLRTVRMGSFYLYADFARNQRGQKHNTGGKPQQETKKGANETKKSFAEVLKNGTQGTGKNHQVYRQKTTSNPSKDDVNSKIKKRNMELNCEDVMDLNSTQFSLLAKVNDVQVLHNLYSAIKLVGFNDFHIVYVGGRWVWIDLVDANSLSSFKLSPVINQLFSEFKSIDKDFILDEKVVWLDIVGLPLCAWTSNSFKRIGALWGESLFADFVKGESLALGKVCVLTKHMTKIQEELVIKVHGTCYDVSVNEFAYWAPDLELDVESEYYESSISTKEQEVDIDKSVKTKEKVGNDGDDDGLSSNSDDHSSNDKSSELSSTKRLMNDDRSARSVFFYSDLCKDHSDGDCGNEAIEDNADVIPSNKVSFESNQNSSFPEVVEELSSLERSGAKEERTPHRNNGLDDHDVFLLNGLLHQDKCRVRPVKVDANENFKVSSEASLKQDQSINEVTGSGKQKQSSSFVLSPSTPPVTDLKLAEESCSTWLDYVGPLSTDELDPEICWSYKDPSGDVQGPFSLAQLHKWKDYFPSDFKIWRYYGSVKDTVLLHSALKRRTKDVG